MTRQASSSSASRARRVVRATKHPQDFPADRFAAPSGAANSIALSNSPHRCSCHPSLSAVSCLASARVPDSASAQQRRLVPADGGPTPGPGARIFSRQSLRDHGPQSLHSDPLQRVALLPENPRGLRGFRTLARCIVHCRLPRRLLALIFEPSPESFSAPFAYHHRVNVAEHDS